MSDGYFKDNYTNYSSSKLCEIIISSRYLGIMNEEAILCMQELATRRSNGDNFEYELFILNESKKLPDFKFNMKNKMNLGIDLSFLKLIK